MKWIGVLFVFVGCGYIGVLCGHCYRQEEACLQQLCEHLQYMICQLRYQQTPLPELFSQLKTEAKQPLRTFFAHVFDELQTRTSSDASGCLMRALESSSNLPVQTRNCLLLLGRSLGRFDLSGQLSGAETVYEHCKEKCAKMEKNHTVYIRSYMIFGLCAGAAIAVLLL